MQEDKEGGGSPVRSSAEWVRLAVRAGSSSEVQGMARAVSIGFAQRFAVGISQAILDTATAAPSGGWSPHFSANGSSRRGASSSSPADEATQHTGEGDFKYQK